MQSHCAPAGSDFQNMISRLQTKLAAKTVNLLNLGVLERSFFALVNSRGVDHLFVQEQPEEIVAQIVMFMDVSP